MPAPVSLVLRLSVPAEGVLRVVAAELAVRVAEYLGEKPLDAATVSSALEGVAARVAPGGGGDNDIEFDFRQVDGELLIEARCGSRSSEVRCPLPA
jgi:hypothetical protein